MSRFKEMSVKEKVEYIWDYYKIHIIAGLSITFLIGYFIYSQVTQINYIFNLTVLSNMQKEKSDSLQNELTRLLVNNQNKDEALVSILPLKDTMSIQKLVAQISANEIDLIIMDKAEFNKFSNENMFIDLETLKELDLNSIKYDKLKTENNSASGTYAISVENNKLLQEKGIDTKDKVIGIVASTKNVDKALSVLKWLLKQ